MLLAREYRRPFWAHHLATRASRGVSLVAMGADPHDLPSGFSVVSDSIRRDREALFGATRLDVPTIADGDDSSDGSDVEAPVFFTTTGSDAEAEAEGFGGPLPPRSPLAETAGLRLRGRAEPDGAPEGGRSRTNRPRPRPRRRTANAVILRGRGRRSRGARGVRARRGAGAAGGGGALEQARARAPARGARRATRRNR